MTWESAHAAYECTCQTETQMLTTCPRCGYLRFLVRDPRLLTEGAPVAYDPMCGHTVSITPPPESPMGAPEAQG